EVAEGPPLTPPDTSTWGPAQRRLGADEIALQWAIWREQIRDTDFANTGDTDEPSAADDPGDPDQAPAPAESAAGTDDQAGQNGQADGSTGHGGVRRVLAEARAYVETPPPLGRVRSSFAPGEARTLRADGPGWSLVARTDDIAFVLLDAEPGEVLPIG